MSDIIQLLPDSVANQIAAGEVIQRPASVVKELMENAVDAGATKIDVKILDAGRTLIQVVDNGKGMSETDARLAFERHATSKIRKAADLFELRTMGFRGEALASIAAVAQVKLKTKRNEDTIGTQLSISGYKFEGQEPVTCPDGCNFMIENLFFNVPARRKFLKSNTTETSNIIEAFERIALINQNIEFTLTSDNTEVLHLPPANLRQRIIDIFGKRLNQDLLPVNVDTTMCRISGFTGKPESAKKKAAKQYFFVNGRYMRHPYFHKAVMTPYERIISEGTQIPYFLYLEVNPQDIDVNIHPTKTEIKFENESAIWQIIMATVKESVGKFSEVPSIDFNTDSAPDLPVFSDDADDVEVPHVEYNSDYNPFDQSSSTTPSYHSSSKSTEGWESMYEGLEKHSELKQMDLFGTGISNFEDTPTEDTPLDRREELTSGNTPTHFQYKGKYIMTTVKSGLMIIDQHRAHMRILYDRFMHELQDEQRMSDRQIVLFPEIIHFSPDDILSVEKMMPELQRMGFDLSPLGSGSYSITAVPASVSGINGKEIIEDIIADARKEIPSGNESIWHIIALEMARKSSVCTGQVLSNTEMETIVNELFVCSNVNYTPDKKLILCILKEDEIENLLN